MKSEAAVEVEGLRMTYGAPSANVTVLNDIAITVRSGDFFVIVGESGSGKSTLLRCIAGLERPQAGRIQLQGRLVYSGEQRVMLRAQDRHIGMVFQSYAIWPHLTVLENITLPLIRGRTRLRKDEANQRGMQVLERVGLAELAGRRGTDLSGGQQQRVALARALSVDSKIVLMDEPLSNLESKLRERLKGYLKEVVEEFDVTALYVTHDRSEALSLGDRIAVMCSGEVLQVGTPEELYERPNCQYVAETLGDVSWIDLPHRASASELSRLLEAAKLGVAPAGRAATVGVRPEGVSVMRDGQGDAAYRPAAIELRGVALTSEYYGTRQRVVVRVGPVELLAWTEEQGDLAGANVVVRVDRRAIVTVPDRGPEPVKELSTASTARPS